MRVQSLGRVLELVDLDAPRVGGGDLSRFKAAMLTAKAKGLPLSRGGGGQRAA